MTFRFCDGFDSYSSASQLLSKWSSGSNLGLTTTGGRFGGGALTNALTSLASTSLNRGVSIPSGAKVRVGFSIKYPVGQTGSVSQSAFVLGLNTNCVLHLNGAGLLSVSNLSSSVVQLTSLTAVNDGAWHWVELEYFLNGASGSAQLWIDGVAQGSVTANIGAAAVVSSVTFGFGSAGTASVGSAFIDDAVIWDDQGSTFNTFPLGPRRISTLVPNADGDLVQFTPKTGTSHFAMVNGGYASTNYVSDTGTGNTELFRFPSLSYSPTSLTAVVGNYFGQNTGSGSTNLIPKLKTSGTTASGSTLTLTVGANSLLQSSFVTDAGGAAWTASAVNAMQLGMGS